MVRTGPAWGIPLFLFVALAGCVDSQPKTVVAGPTATLTDDTGGIEGVVTNDEIIPLPGVNITLQGVATVYTDGGGRFAFSNLDPGAYNVTATSLAYQTQSKIVDVRAGEIVSLRLALVRIPLDYRWVEFFQFHGNLTVGTPGTGPLNTGAVDGVDRLNFTFPIRGADPNGELAICTQVEVTLKTTSPTALDLDLYLYNETGAFMDDAATGAPNEQLVWTKKVPPQTLKAVVHFWAGAKADVGVYVNASYAVGLAAELELYKED